MGVTGHGSLIFQQAGGASSHCDKKVSQWPERNPQCASSSQIFACVPYMNLDSILKTRDITLLTKVHLVKAMFFSSSHVMDVRVGPLRKLSVEELTLLSYDVGEDS